MHHPMKNYLLAFMLPLALVAKAQNIKTFTLQHIAFGSCANQEKRLDILDKVVAEQPQLFIFLGDNIYGDTEDMSAMQAKYNQLAAQPAYQNLQAATQIVATWDDHDYGHDDMGKEYPMKTESKKLFLDFFKEPAASERRKHEGIYTSYMFGEDGKRVQVILLDCRNFRDSLCFKKHPKIWGEYQKCTDTTKTMLGETQWQWLEQELQKPADVRLIGSSTMFLVDYNGWEAWMNFPHENERMLQLIKKTNANGVIFISGDIHHGEISKREVPGLYPIYDITSSGLTHYVWFANKNKYRVGTAFCQLNYGTAHFNWEDRSVLFEIKNKRGKTVRKQNIWLSELKL